MADTIGVVTVTRQRPDRLRRSMASVYAQDYPGEIEHVIVADEDPGSVETAVAAPTRQGRSVVALSIARPPSERSDPPGDKRRIYPRLSRLFNLGARVSTADWIAYLDDDNEFEPIHLSSLFACAKANNADAVHSGRSMVCPDGSPYLEERWHTVPDPVEASRIFELMCDRGVRIRGTNILLDRADPVTTVTLRPSSVIGAGDPVLLVDQSVWLIRRELLLRHPIPETFTDEEFEMNAAPDDKLLQVLIEAGIRLYTTSLPTVRYYLGGVSNRYQTA